VRLQKQKTARKGGVLFLVIFMLKEHYGVR